MIDDWKRIVDANQTFCIFLDLKGGFPGLVYEFRWEGAQLRQVFSDVVAIRVCLLAETNWTVDSKILIKEAGSTKPHPVGCVETPISIKQQMLKHLFPSFPGNIKISSGQKACYCVSRQMVNPALLFELRHNSIYKGIACFAVLPSLQVLLVFIPFDLLADRVAFYFIEVRDVGTVEIKKFSPD